MTKASGTPFQLGYDAGVNGKSDLICPYKQDTPSYRRWQQGHKRGVEMTWFLRINKTGKEAATRWHKKKSSSK